LVSTKGSRTIFAWQSTGRLPASGRSGVGWCGWGLVKGDPQLEARVPAADRDLSYKQAHEPLPAVEVECVDPVRVALGEPGDTLAEPVADGEIVALGGEGGALAG
jgi:hypothetical protein